MRIFLLFGILVFAALQISAQKTFKKNTFFFQLGGSGGSLSLNYERQLGDAPGFGIHIGAGLGDSKPTIPFGASYLFCVTKKSLIEVGADITLAGRSVWDDLFTFQLDNPYKPGFIPSIGFRHHTPYGLMYKFEYTPVFTQYRNIPWYCGISVGWQI